MRADAAAPAAPVGAHARARARIHEHRREPLYIDTPCSGNLIDIPCCPGSTSTLRRALGRARFSFDLARCSTGAARLGISRQQVRSHPAPGLTQRPKAQVKAIASLSREPLSPPSLRAQVSTARRDCGRVGIALRFRRAWSRSSSATPRAEGSSGRQVVSASALALKAIAGPQVALGRAGDGPRAFPGWEAASVHGALRRQRRRSSRGRLSRAYPPWAASPRSSAWRGGGVKIGKVYGTVFFRLRIV